MKSIFVLSILLLLYSCQTKKHQQKYSNDKLIFSELALTWDEAMPLGNGMVGNLVWQKNGKLRFSLDRADLWDLRPMANIDFNKWKFEDVYQHWKNDTYEEVQKAFDEPYNKLAAPSKIPAGAIEFDISKLGDVVEVSLNIKEAICKVIWNSGAVLTTFVHAEKPLGWYKFENLSEAVPVDLIPPAYNRENEEGYTSQSKNDLNQLGYPQGTVLKEESSLVYNQQGWGDFKYQISTSWEEGEKSLTGCWSVSSENKGWEAAPKAKELVAQELREGIDNASMLHRTWWQDYWSKSSLIIPDSLLQKQYDLEMYKFGAAARADAPPIALQSVWTADHGKLPPWKGDFHHDLNTQLSYWPAYAGNQLELEEGFINWLWKYRPAFKKYTNDYFGAEGLNVPGVTTLEGEPMGGWIQYSFGQTVSAWLSHHFYLHWKFSGDTKFLKEKAYPWLKDVSIFIEEVSVIENGKRKLKISSSPEIFNNSREAWFAETSNFDLALIHWNLAKTAEMAKELGLDDEESKWLKLKSEWPELAIDKNTGLMFAPGQPYHESHRHFSHLMAFHPLGTIDYANGEKEQLIITNTLNHLAAMGSDWWTGYSFSWQANLYARAFMGEKAVEALRIFAECFCLRNSFHVNGDQCKAGHSKMTYRPFTLEGNFAFASAVQEMLIQSHTETIVLFPAIPDDWKNLSFQNLRTYGAFLVSASMKDGRVSEVHIVADKGGELCLKNPFEGENFKSKKKFELKNNKIICFMEKGERISFKNASF